MRLVALIAAALVGTAGLVIAVEAAMPDHPPADPIPVVYLDSGVRLG